MNVNPRRPIFNRRPQANIYRMFVWVVMLLGGVWMLQQIDRGEIQPLFLPTPIPTRSTASYALEGDANFSAGKVEAAILAYRNAVEADPNNAETWWKLARIQTYSSTFVITNEEKKARLQEALQSATKAVELAPDDSTARAVRAFVLDWNANRNFYTAEEVQDFLIEERTKPCKPSNWIVPMRWRLHTTRKSLSISRNGTRRNSSSSRRWISTTR